MKSLTRDECEARLESQTRRVNALRMDRLAVGRLAVRLTPSEVRQPDGTLLWPKVCVPSWSAADFGNGPYVSDWPAFRRAADRMYADFGRRWAGRA